MFVFRFLQFLVLALILGSVSAGHCPVTVSDLNELIDTDAIKDMTKKGVFKNAKSAKACDRLLVSVLNDAMYVLDSETAGTYMKVATNMFNGLMAKKGNIPKMISGNIKHCDGVLKTWAKENYLDSNTKKWPGLKCMKKYGIDKYPKTTYGVMKNIKAAMMDPMTSTKIFQEIATIISASY